MNEPTSLSLRTPDGRRKFFDDIDKSYGHMLATEKGRQAALLLLDTVIRSDRLVRHVFFRRCVQRLDLPKDEEEAIRAKLNLGKDAEVMRSDEYRELVGPYDPDVAARGIKRAKPKSWWQQLFGS